MIVVKLGCDRSRYVAVAANFCLFNPYFFSDARSLKRHEIGKKLLWKANGKSCVVSVEWHHF